MYLRAIHLTNYRAYPEATLEIGPSGLVVVTGPNNAGKSALLSALDMVGGQPVDGPLQLTGAAEPCSVVADFEFTDDEKRQLASAKAESSAEIEAALIGVTYRFADVGDNQRRLGVVSAEITHRGGSWPIARVAPNGAGNGQLFQVSWAAWLNAWPDKPSIPEHANVSGSGITRSLESSPGPSVVPAWLQDWRAGYYHFKALRQGQPDRTGTAEAAPTLDPTGSNLANHLQWLRANQEDAWDRIRETIKELIVDIGRLQVRLNGGQSEVGFDTGIRGFENLKDVGTGVEQLLMAITVGQTAAGSLLIIEEPETNLNPGSQRQLMAHLEEWSATRPIVIATHSPTIIDAANDGRLYEVRRASGKSSVVKIARESDEIVSLLFNLGVRFSDLLGSDRILVVEGPTDRGVLQVWFPRLATRNAVAVVPGGGGAGVWQIELMETVAAMADRLPRPLLYLRDRDELSDRDLDRLAKRKAIRVLRRRELENYLLDADAIVAVLSQRSPDGSKLDSSSIASELRRIADGLKERVIRGRVLENATSLRKVVPVAMKERRRVYRASDPIEEIVDLVKPKLENPLRTLEDDLRVEFERQAELVNNSWDDKWIELVPGADVLSLLFQQHGTTFSKEVDGPLLAKAMKEPPAEIRQLLKGFV